MKNFDKSKSKNAKIGGWYFHFDKNISENTLNEIPMDSNKSPDKKTQITGRGNIYIKEIEDIFGKRSELVIRKYYRGGLVSKLISDDFLIPLVNRFPDSTRPWNEFNCLNYLRSKGIKVPKPAFCSAKRTKGFFYKGFIATYLVKNSENLLLFLSNNSKNISNLELYCLSYHVGMEAKKILKEGIFHVDLHVGNVLNTPNGTYIIDLDKSKLFTINKKNITFYKDKLIQRWNRSILKKISYNLMHESLIKGFSDGLK